MEGIEGEHAEYADDNCVWENGEIPVEEIVKMKKVNKQCLLDTPRTVRVSEKK